MVNLIINFFEPIYNTFLGFILWFKYLFLLIYRNINKIKDSIYDTDPRRYYRFKMNYHSDSVMRAFFVIIIYILLKHSVFNGSTYLITNAGIHNTLDGKNQKTNNNW